MPVQLATALQIQVRRAQARVEELEESATQDKARIQQLELLDEANHTKESPKMNGSHADNASIAEGRRGKRWESLGRGARRRVRRRRNRDPTCAATPK